MIWLQLDYGQLLWSVMVIISQLDYDTWNPNCFHEENIALKEKVEACLAKRGK